MCIIVLINNNLSTLVLSLLTSNNPIIEHVHYYEAIKQ